jgi:1-phosphofructokinase
MPSRQGADSAISFGTVQARLLVVSPNLALDHVNEVDVLEELRVMQADSALFAGGKGVVVGRTAVQLGADVAVHGFLGGLIGRKISELSSLEGIELVPVEVSGESRIDTVIVERVTMRTRVINTAGSITVAESDVELLLTNIEEGLQSATTVVCTGSLPNSVPESFYADVITESNQRGIRTALDTSGSVLVESLAARPRIVRVNLGEVERAFNIRPGSEISDVDRAQAAARELLSAGARCAVVGLGPHGCVVASGTQEDLVSAAGSPSLLKFGAGDAFMAGLACSPRYASPTEAAILAAAVSASTLSSRYPGIARSDDVARLRRSVGVVGLSKLPGRG